MMHDEPRFEDLTATGRPAGHTLRLGRGLALNVSYPSGPDTVHLGLAWRGRSLLGRSFAVGRSPARLAADLKIVKVGVALQLDVFAGEVVLSLDRSFKGRAPVCTRRVLLRFAPSLGRIADSVVVHAPVVDDAAWGRSQLCTPAVLRLFVDDSRRFGTPVGARVKEILFPDHPPFVFNTVACVGGVYEDAPGLYGDPESHWFNVFLGYYQVDCDKSLWSRPFAYRAAESAASVVDPDEVLRLGKADWNWFSNWIYGVPGDVALSWSSLGGDEVTVAEPRLVLIGGRRWHQLRLSGAQMASCYEAGVPARRLVRHFPLGALWRRAFGLPHPRPQFPQSFVATSLEALCSLCYWEDDTTFHTVIFGACAAVGTNPGFIAVQQAALQRVIEQAYPSLGF